MMSITSTDIRQFAKVVAAYRRLLQEALQTLEDGDEAPGQAED
jgi:hypothetical protein